MVQRLKPAAESLYGFPQPTQSNLLAPIIAKRPPLSTDTGYSLGQVWIDKTDGVAYTLVLVSAGVATWAVQGGSGVNGIATLVAGTVTVSAPAVNTNSVIQVSVNTPGGTGGTLSVPVASITAGTSFVINSSSNTDTSTVNWTITR